MRKLKRILAVVFSVLLIFTVLCTSVFAWSPNNTDMTNLFTYTPAINLQSIQVRSGPANNIRYFSLTSPYSLSMPNCFGRELSEAFEYPIGAVRSKANGQVQYKVTNNFSSNATVGGDGYIKQTVALTSSSNSYFDFIFHYGNSILPVVPVDAEYMNFESIYPFFTTYDFSLKSTIPEEIRLQLQIDVNLLSYTYSYDADSSNLYFSSEPHYENVVLSQGFILNYNTISEGLYSYNAPIISLADYLVPLAEEYMIDDTSNATPPRYLFIDSLDVSFIATFVNDEFDAENYITCDRAFFTDYVLDPNALERYVPFFPSSAQALEWFSDSFPVYTTPTMNVSFTDFLDSIGSIFDIQLIGTFSLGDLLFGIVGIGMLIWFIKMFAGG